ncbi:hypothetical protein [Methylobacterium sp. Leaf89]|uniref:hypothetical protein n=1 Tax=Methylobacterium sp. Leaf89 TaxID=1736245 RepID=UPI0012E9573C|nr:hypothetical protein [Methylobacterium sp. Leaf89]
MTNTNVSESAPLFAGEGSPLNLEAEVARINGLAAEVQEAEEEGHRRTYRRIAAMLGFVERVHNNTLYAEAWSKMLVERKIPKPGKGTNEFNQYVTMLGGSFADVPSKKKGEEGKLVTRWVRDRSCEKYSKVIRWCFENDVKSDVAADRIENFVDPDAPGKNAMRGIELADARKYPSTPRVSKLKTAEEEAVREAEGLGELPVELGAHVKSHRGYSVLIVRHDEDRLVVLGDAGLSANQVIDAVKRGKKGGFTTKAAR